MARKVSKVAKAVKAKLDNDDGMDLSDSDDERRTNVTNNRMGKAGSNHAQAGAASLTPAKGLPRKPISTNIGSTGNSMPPTGLAKHLESNRANRRDGNSPELENDNDSELDELDNFEFDSDYELGEAINLELEPDDSNDELDDLDFDSPLQSHLGKLGPKPNSRAASKSNLTLAKPAAKSRVTIFPSPPTYKMAWDKFTWYWNQCYQDPVTRPRLKLYVYRSFPVMLEGYRQVEILLGEPPPNEPEKLAKPMTLDDVLHRYGSGDYHFKLNDMGAGNKQICQCNLNNNPRMRDWESYPAVLDMEGVDTSDPLNKSFLVRVKQWRRGAEEGDMESAKVLERMSEKMVELAGSNRNASSSSDAKAAEVMANAASSAIEIVANAAKQYGNNQGNQIGSQMEFMQGMLSLVKEMRPPDNSMQTMLEALRAANEREQAALRQQMDFMATMLKETMESRRAANDKPEKSPIEQLRELAESKDALRSILGGGGSRRGGSDWMEALPAFAPAINSAMQSLQIIATGFMQRALAGNGGMPGPMPGPQQQGVPMGQLPPGTQAGAPGMPNAGAGMAPGQPAGQNGPSQGTGILQALQDPQFLGQYVEMLRRPILRMLGSSDATGEDFATWLADWQGEEHCIEIASLGSDVLVQLLMSYEPIMTHIKGDPTPLMKFIGEFLEAVKHMADMGNEDDGDQSQGQMQGPQGQGQMQGQQPQPNGAMPNYMQAGQFAYPEPEPTPSTPDVFDAFEAEDLAPSTTTPKASKAKPKTAAKGK